MHAKGMQEKGSGNKESSPTPHAAKEGKKVSASLSSAAAGSPTASRLRLALAGLLTAGLLWLSYFPVAWGWLGWVALVPFLTLVRSEAPARRLYLAAWLAGLAFFWPILQWMRVADDRMYATWAALATYCSLYLPGVLVLLRRLDRRSGLPLVVTLPVVWTALEYLRAHFLTGFAWYFLGHTQHACLPLIQVADLAGAYAVTFLVAAVNALLFELLYTRSAFRQFFALPTTISSRGPRTFVLQGSAVLILLAGILAYGFWRLGQEDFAAGPRIALIQGNLDQRIRNEATADEASDAAATMVHHYKELSHRAAAGQPRPDLLVWPETSYPGEWMEVAPELPAARVPEKWQSARRESQELAQVIAAEWQTNVLLGLNAECLEADGRASRYNSALLIQTDAQVGGRYDKIHRVPFGEYVPLRDWLPWMNTFAPYDFDYSIRAGEHLTRFPLGPYHFGVIICYEDTDPGLARQYVHGDDGKPAVDFLLNISNDGWFNGTSEHEEHLAICRFRAVECRRAVARAVNMGISAMIDGNGRVVALPGPTWGQSKKIAAVLTAVVPLDRRASLYACWGDWLPCSCWLILTAGLLQTVVWPRRVTRRMLG
jgi:apolipoprotein N-acyltransferase